MHKWDACVGRVALAGTQSMGRRGSTGACPHTPTEKLRWTLQAAACACILGSFQEVAGSCLMLPAASHEQRQLAASDRSGGE